MARLTDLTIYVYDPSNTSVLRSDADATLEAPGAVLLPFEIRRAGQGRVGSFRIAIRNNDGSYTNMFARGTRLLVDMEVRAPTNTGGTTTTLINDTLLVKSVTRIASGPEARRVVLEGTDWMPGIAQDRAVVGSTRSFGSDEFAVQIAGPSDAIVNTIVRENSPINRTNVDSITRATSGDFAYRNLLEALRDLAERGDAYFWGEGVGLQFTDSAGLSAAFVVDTSEDLLEDIEHREDGREITNDVYAVGRGGVVGTDSDATSQTDYGTVHGILNVDTGTQSVADAQANAEVERAKDPDSIISVVGQTKRMLQLEPMDLLQINLSTLNLSGNDLAVIERTTRCDEDGIITVEARCQRLDQL